MKVTATGVPSAVLHCRYTSPDFLQPFFLDDLKDLLVAHRSVGILFQYLEGETKEVRKAPVSIGANRARKSESTEINFHEPRQADTIKRAARRI